MSKITKYRVCLKIDDEDKMIGDYDDLCDARKRIKDAIYQVIEHKDGIEIDSDQALPDGYSFELNTYWAVLYKKILVKPKKGILSSLFSSCPPDDSVGEKICSFHIITVNS